MSATAYSTFAQPAMVAGRACMKRPAACMPETAMASATASSIHMIGIGALAPIFLCGLLFAISSLSLAGVGVVGLVLITGLTGLLSLTGLGSLVGLTTGLAPSAVRGE